MFKKIFQSSEEKKARNDLNKINLLRNEMANLSDENLKTKTKEFQERLVNGETENDIRIEVFAVVREATYRVLKKWPFDVQVLGGLILDMGSVAEMKTGEGKTITSLMPVYLNALRKKGVVVSTVNEYLTQRDAEEMGQVYNWLGLTVGVNLRELNTEQKRLAYNCDITYSVHSEIGFDYLRDNMVSSPDEKVQRSFHYALIDEVDSILIDEAKTPLIISGGSEEPSHKYMKVDSFVKGLDSKDFDIDWESKGIQLTEQGADKANQFFQTDNIFSIENSDVVNKIQNSLRANKIMKIDGDYIVRDDKVELVDAFTGRIMEGRSYSDGLQQAIQAKENVSVEPEMQTLATITYQNLFRMFNKLCGMSGTAKTEENEFIEIYNMRVHVIPTNLPMIRIDYPDMIYPSWKAKHKAIVESIVEHNKKGQPILVGTMEVSESEKLSKSLQELNLKHTVLNAKQNEKEAEIISMAGQKKAITIATNMAGRGTDIQPSLESLELGGLYVIGTNKAEARRIDNQLKGRSGRQGDVGESRFFVSLDDVLISRFSNQKKFKKMFASFGDNHISGNAIRRVFKKAQIKIEGFNFDTRKNVLQYDDIIRQQRDLIYSQRDIIIGHVDLFNVIERMMKSAVKEIILDFDNFRSKDKNLDIQKIVATLNQVWFKISDFKLAVSHLHKKTEEQILKRIQKDLIQTYLALREEVVENIGEESMHEVERRIILQTFDQNWQMHIDKLAKLRSASSLESYAQKNPFQIYLQRSSDLFHELLKRISHNSIKLLMNNSYAIKKEDPEIEKLKNQIEEHILNDESKE